MKNITSLLLTFQVILLALPASAQLTANDDFEYQGIRYTVVDINGSVIGLADGSEECENLFSYNPSVYLHNSPVVSDPERGNVYKCDILANPENPWDSQFFIKSDKAFKAGQNIKVSFMYKCTDERNIETQAHGDPFDYHHWQCIGTLNATTEWQEYSWSGSVGEDWIGDNGFISIAFNLSSLPEAATFFIDDVVFEERNTCMTKAREEDALLINDIKGDIVIPSIVEYDGVIYSVVGIGDRSFSDNIQLNSISLPESLTSIGLSAFKGCSGLTSISLPKFIESIGVGAFRGCSQIETVSYLANTPITASSNIFDEYIYQSAVLYMPNANIADIKNTMPWYKFEHIVTKEGEYNFYKKLITWMYPGPGHLFSWGDGLSQEDFIEENGDECVEFSHSGVDDVWRAQIAYDCLYKTGETYFFSFDVKGDPGVITSNFQNCSTEEYPNCGNFEDFEITPEWTTITIKGTVEDTGNIVNRWVANVGEYEGSFFIRNLKLYTLVDHPIVPPTIDNEISIAEMYPGPYQLIRWGDGISSRIEMDENGGECFMMTNSAPDTPSSAQFSFDCQYEIGKTYYLTFDVKGNTAVITSQFENNGTYTNCGNCSDFEITSKWTTVTVMGKTEDKGEIVNRWVANIGDYEGSMYIRNMKIYTLAEEPIAAGETFTYNGVNYAVIDPIAQTCKAIAAHPISGDYLLPEAVPYRSVDFSVIEIGDGAFAGNTDLRSVTLPATIAKIGQNALVDCRCLTSFVWQGQRELPERVVAEIGNPNLLVYVDASEYAPAGLDCNLVVDGVCQLLDLTPGYAFTPVKDFTALRSRMVKEFTQMTYVGLCAGWETIVLPFDVAKVYAENIESELVPFSWMTDRYSQRPYWLYEADPEGEWMEAPAIRAGVPYIISTPNNSAYPANFNVNGTVVFSNETPQRISPEITAPYSVSWASGSEFRSLWLPLDASGRTEAMALNSGISYLKGEDGKILPPGSAFHAEVVPSPLEGYVTRLGSERARKVMDSHTVVLPVSSDEGLEVRVKDGAIYARSASSRSLTVFMPDGSTVRTVFLNAGETVAIEGLTRGIYIIAGRKVTVK